jgi:asparagine synthase (glutamine-hydrolysing)
MQCKPYWELPTDGQFRYKRSGDYVEQFRELLQTAVDDRIRGVGSVGLTMSGGLDSSAVAVAACRASARRDPGPAVRAFTAVYDHVVPDQERHYSGLVAAKLGIGVDYLSADAYLPFAHWQRSELAYPEPSHGPLPDIHLDLYRRLADHSRVVLTGHGADALLRPSQLAGLAGRVPTVSLLLNALQVGIHYRQLPNFGLRSKIRRRMGVVPGVPVLPGWLRPSFAARLDLAARWEQLHRPSPPRHRLRPDAYASLSGTFWPGYLSAFDPGVTMVPVESRFPFFDVRLVTFALAIPPVPWCVNKHLLREALRGHVPESVRQRPKSPVAGDAVAVLLREHAPSAEAFVATPELEQYVDIRAATKGSPIGDPAAWWTDLRPWSLNHWLRHRDQLAVPDRVGEVLALNPQGRCAGAKIRWEQ